MILKVKKPIGKVEIEINTNETHRHEDIIEGLKEYNIFVNLRDDTILNMDEAKLLEIDDYISVREVLKELCYKGKLILHHKKANKHYRNKPVKYKIG